MKTLKIITLLNLNALSIIGMALGLTEHQLNKQKLEMLKIEDQINKQKLKMLKQEITHLTAVNKQLDELYNHGKNTTI